MSSFLDYRIRNRNFDMGKTKFQQKWTLNRLWLSNVKDIYQAKCNACGDILNITSGIGAIKHHENTPKHLKNFAGNKKQLQFVFKESGSMELQSVDKTIILCFKDSCG